MEKVLKHFILSQSPKNGFWAEIPYIELKGLGVKYSLWHELVKRSKDFVVFRERDLLMISTLR